MINLKGKPFYLSDEDIQWVEATLKGMTKEEKIGQLFCPIGLTKEESDLKELLDKYHVGGLMFRPDEAKVVQDVHRFIQNNSKIPMLLAANLEAGGTGLVQDGTLMGCQLQIAATDNIENAYRLGVVSGREANAVGGNWAFAPVVDIDYNYRNPITNTRTYGSDPDRVLNMGKAYMQGIHENGLSVSIKHFPGDGVDSRDQHLLTSVNTLSVKEWDETFGKVYQTLIDEGAQTVMIGHIQLPEYQRLLRPELKDDEFMPATLAPELIQDLLREKLGFNGMIVTDATAMTGFTQPMKREDSVPYSIVAGCDMFLFNMGLEQDYQAMMNGIDRGILTMERVEEAVTRILALKASLKLHVKQAEGTLVPGEEALENIKTTEHLTWAKQCADEAITLVKNKEGILPLSPKRFKKVLVHVLGDQEKAGSHSGGGALSDTFINRLKDEGFSVDKFSVENLDIAAMHNGIKAFIGDYDLIIYYANVGTYSNQTIVRLNWAEPMGANVPRFISEVPTMFVSVAGPYHLEDVPRIKTFINCYMSSENIVNSLVEKLMGRSEFKGINPVDPFCGMWDTKL